MGSYTAWELSSELNQISLLFSTSVRCWVLGHGRYQTQHTWSCVAWVSRHSGSHRKLCWCQKDQTAYSLRWSRLPPRTWCL